MDDQRKESRQASDGSERARWEAPKIQRLETRGAEGAVNVGADLGIYS